MAATAVIRFCKDCKEEYGEGHKYCTSCAHNPRLHIKCPTGAFKGRLDSWYIRHRPECRSCNPGLAIQAEAKHESKEEKKTKALHQIPKGTFHIIVLIVSVIMPYNDLESKICSWCV
jgi:hypothetical protein